MGGDLSYQEKYNRKIEDAIRAVFWRLTGLIVYHKPTKDERMPSFIQEYNNAKAILGETSSSLCI